MDIGDQPDLGFARPRVKQKKKPTKQGNLSTLTALASLLSPHRFSPINLFRMSFTPDYQEILVQTGSRQPERMILENEAKA